MILVVKRVISYAHADKRTIRTDRHPGRDTAHCVELIPIPESNRRELLKSGKTYTVDPVLGIKTEYEIKGELKS